MILARSRCSCKTFLKVIHERCARRPACAISRESHPTSDILSSTWCSEVFVFVSDFEVTASKTMFAMKRTEPPYFKKTNRSEDTCFFQFLPSFCGTVCQSCPSPHARWKMLTGWWMQGRLKECSVRHWTKLIEAMRVLLDVDSVIKHSGAKTTWVFWQRAMGRWATICQICLCCVICFTMLAVCSIRDHSSDMIIFHASCSVSRIPLMPFSMLSPIRKASEAMPPDKFSWLIPPCMLLWQLPFCSKTDSAVQCRGNHCKLLFARN